MKIIPIVTLALATGCMIRQQDTSIMQDAADIHNKSVAVKEQVEQQLTALRIDSTFQLKDSLTEILKSLHVWNENLVEVPGNEHYHHKNHNHNHAPVEVTAQEMRELQRELNREILHIEKRIQNLTK